MARASPYYLAVPILAVSRDQSRLTIRWPAAPSESRPSFAGAQITRFPIDFVTVFGQDRVVTIGLVSSISDLCAGGIPVVDGKDTLKDVLTPAGPIRRIGHMSQATIVVYGASPADFCDLATTPVLGRGTGNFTDQDNDLALAGPGADSFGGKITGIVDLTSGGRAHLLVLARFLVGNDGNFRVIVDRFELTPIGH
jgi:hypothetical protein